MPETTAARPGGADYRSTSTATQAVKEVLREHTLMRNYITELERGIDALAGLLREQSTGLREEALQRRMAHLLGKRHSPVALDLRRRGLLWSGLPTQEGGIDGD